jgi:hypothetical protein
MSASSKSIARSAAQNGTILSKSVDEEKRYKASSAAQKSIQKPTPLGPPSINSQELAHSRRQYRIAQEYKRLTKLSKHRDKETFVTTLDLRVPW